MGIPALGIPALGIGTLLAGVLLVGFSWNSVVSVTAAYTSDRYGVRHLGTIYGTRLRHQATAPCSPSCPLAAASGPSWGACSTTLTLGGLGTYAVAIWSNIILLLAAMTLVFFKGETRPPELQTMEAAADGAAA